MNECFALLEDSDDRSEARRLAPAPFPLPRSRLYTGYSRTLRCDTAAGLPQLLEQMQAALAAGEYAVALFSYELGAEQQKVAARLPVGPPLAEILLFKQCLRPDAAELERWLAQQDRIGTDLAATHITNLRASVDRTGFDTAITRIHAYLEAGDCYQVNYTYRLHFDLFGTPLALYRKLRDRQPTRYSALIVMPDQRAIVSCSPELFMQHSAGQLTVQPMKGTAAASGDAETDRQRAVALADDPKNRAENLMIVDLLRNDLGRIAQPGSVQAIELFHVHHFGRVLQMTSTVRATARPDATLADLLAALYPCGSITGAPKLRAMQIIRELENQPRGIYTGALGWFDPPAAHLSAPRNAIGDFCLSVPIRTLALSAPQGGRRPGVLGIGAGIVYDSVAADEFEECQLKARFLTELPPDFLLFETIYATRTHGCRHLERHLQRLMASARYCGFMCDESAVRAALDLAVAAINSNMPHTPHRLRLALAHDGAINVTTAVLPAMQEPVRLFIADRSNPVADLFIAHKTTVRLTYDTAWRAAEQRGGFDQLFVNRSGELTEGGRSSLFVRLDGRWYTPPLSAGVLPGVMRAVLLSDPAWDASERRLTLADLRRAEQVVVCNALRGALQAEVCWD